MDPIDEAIIFLLLTVEFPLPSGLSARLRAEGIQRTLQQGSVGAGPFWSAPDRVNFQGRYGEFLRRLNERLQPLAQEYGLPGEIRANDEAGVAQFFAAASESAAERSSAISSIGQVLREDLKEHSVPAGMDTSMSDVQAAFRHFSLAAFSSTHSFAVDSSIGVVSFEELTKLYERDTGV